MGLDGTPHMVLSVMALDTRYAILGNVVQLLHVLLCFVKVVEAKFFFFLFLSARWVLAEQAVLHFSKENWHATY